MKKNLSHVVLLGAIWGIFEATVGYLLHLSGLRIGSMIWFPVAYFFIHTAYRYTGNISSVMLTAFIAASLKLVNLFFPGRVDMVINPAVSIILEAAAVMLVYKYVLNGKIEKVNPFAVMLTGFAWRSFYIFYILSMPQAYSETASFTTMESFLEFMFVKNGINIIIISAGLFMGKVFKRQFSAGSVRLQEALSRRSVLNPVFAAGSVVLAILVQFFVR